MSELSLRQIKKEWHGSLKAYLIGFFASLLLTIASFLLVVYQLLSAKFLVYGIIGLALTQAIVQLLFFLHLGQESKPRWETLIFSFMFLVLLIIVLGSLWIMYDLNDRVMSGMTTAMPLNKFTTEITEHTEKIEGMRKIIITKKYN